MFLTAVSYYYIHKNNVTSVENARHTISINVCSPKMKLFRYNQYCVESSRRTFCICQVHDCDSFIFIAWHFTENAAFISDMFFSI